MTASDIFMQVGPLGVIGGIAIAAWWNLSTRIDSTNARIDTILERLGVERRRPPRG